MGSLSLGNAQRTTASTVRANTGLVSQFELPLWQAATEHSLVADGGTEIEEELNSHAENSDNDPPVDCEYDGFGGFPCWSCFRTGRRGISDE